MGLFIFCIIVFAEIVLSLSLYKMGRNRSWGMFFNITRGKSFVVLGISISKNSSVSDNVANAVIGIAISDNEANAVIGIVISDNEADTIMGISISNNFAFALIGVSLSKEKALSLIGLSFGKKGSHKIGGDTLMSMFAFSYNSSEIRIFWISLPVYIKAFISFFIGEKEVK
jgi:hypothetical protein